MVTSALFCPGCDQLIDPAGRTCAACGLEFQTARQLIEQALKPGERNVEIALPPVSPRIGEYLVEMTVLTSEQLEETLREQRTQMAAGARKQLGEIMVEKGFIEAKTVDYYLALHALQLKLQLIVGLMNHSITTDRHQKISDPIREMKETLLRFVAVVKTSSTA